MDAVKLTEKPELQQSSYDKVFSNAAMHWILRPERVASHSSKGFTAR
jgi:hypothetical protein